MVGEGRDGVVAVNGGVVDGDAQALEDAAQDEIHVGHTASSSGVKFLLSPGAPFPQGFPGRNGLVDESNDFVSRSSAGIHERLDLPSRTLKIRLKIHSSGFISWNIKEAAAVVQYVHAENVFSCHCLLNISL